MARVGTFSPSPWRAMSRVARFTAVLVAGAVIGVFTLPLFPGPVQDWASGGQRVVGGITDGTVTRKSSSGAAAVRYAGVAVSRPDWCSSGATWNTDEVPRFAVRVPACLETHAVTYLGYWPAPGCAQIGAVPTRRGVVMVKDAAGMTTGVDSTVATRCPR